MSLEDKILERSKEIMTVANAKIRHASVSMLSKVQMRSPVDTGEFRRAWTLTEKAPFHFVVSNGMPQAQVIEYGLFTDKGETDKTIQGFSKQAPKGVARVSIEEVRNEFNGRKSSDRE